MEVRQVKTILWAKDMGRAIAFWSGFGFPTRFFDPHWTELDLGGTVLALHGGHDGSDRPSSLSVEVADVDSALKEIVALGGKVVLPAQTRETERIRLAEARDPEGNQFSVTQYLG